MLDPVYFWGDMRLCHCGTTFKWFDEVLDFLEKVGLFASTMLCVLLITQYVYVYTVLFFHMCFYIWVLCSHMGLSQVSVCIDLAGR